MQRAAVSIPSNTAEGAERGGRDFLRFLKIARGSAAELRTQRYFACKIGVLDQPMTTATAPLPRQRITIFVEFDGVKVYADAR
jgi:four helix bundle protein